MSADTNDGSDAAPEGDGDDGPWTVFVATPSEWTPAHAAKLVQLS